MITVIENREKENKKTLDHSSAYFKTNCTIKCRQSLIIALNCMPILDCYTVIGFLIQIFLIFGKTQVKSTCTPSA